MADVKYIAYDTSKSPNSVTKTLVSNHANIGADRDIKMFDLGTFSFLVDDLFSGYKIPNYMTDWGRDKTDIIIDYNLVEGVHGDNLTELEATAWDHYKFFMLTCYSYRYNKLEIGDNIKTDNTSTEGSGTEPLYCRVKNWTCDIDMEDQGGISCKLTLWKGQVVRLID